MSTTSERWDEYNRRAAEEGAKLDAALAGIRRSQDAGELTAPQAADARIRALEAHVAAIRDLRVTLLGDEPYAP